MQCTKGVHKFAEIDDMILFAWVFYHVEFEERDRTKDFRRH